MTPSPAGPVNWSRKLAPYKSSRTPRGLLELALTVVPLVLLWAAAWAAFHAGLWWLSLALALPAGGFLVRLFMIQHDCGHGSFFPAKAANDWLGRTLGVFTLTPYDYWRRTHAEHHSNSGDLDRRGLGAVETLTVEEYRALPRLRRLGYRLYRHPAVMFGLGPVYLFFIQHRLPVGLMSDWRPWVSTLGTSATTVVVFAVLAVLFGAAPVLLVAAATMLVAATAGVWLFYVQHQFEGVAWSRSSEWKPQPAALSSSSHYHLPAPLRWLTADIGVHHVHHLSSRIPSYRLAEVLRDHPELSSMSRLGFLESFRCARLALWDEANRRLVSFREAKAIA